jgi:hypothetical protein
MRHLVKADGCVSFSAPLGEVLTLLQLWCDEANESVDKMGMRASLSSKSLQQTTPKWVASASCNEMSCRSFCSACRPVEGDVWVKVWLDGMTHGDFS